MQRFLIICAIFVALISNTLQAIASDNEYANVTRDPQLIAALNVLKTTKSNWAFDAIKGNNSSKRPARVMFRDLSKMNTEYANFEALTCLDSTDKIYIFINTKHKNAPPEAIASILAHEALHQDAENSILEETTAWSAEAITWSELIKRDPSLVQSPSALAKRLNTLATIYSTTGVDGIKRKVMSNSAYKTLAMASAGFED